MRSVWPADTSYSFWIACNACMHAGAAGLGTTDLALTLIVQTKMCLGPGNLSPAGVCLVKLEHKVPVIMQQQKHAHGCSHNTGLMILSTLTDPSCCSALACMLLLSAVVQPTNQPTCPPADVRRDCAALPH